MASAGLSARSVLAQAKPNSNFDGVQIGVITYSFNGMPAEEMIPAMAKIGVSAVELTSDHAEELAGALGVPFGGGRGA